MPSSYAGSHKEVLLDHPPHNCHYPTCIRFFLTVTNQLTPNRCPAIQFQHFGISVRSHNPQVKGTQSHKTAPISDDSHQAWATCTSDQLYLWLTQRFPWPLLGFDNLVEWLTALDLCLPVYYKGYNSGIPKWKRCTGHHVGRDMELPGPLQAGHPPGCSPTWKLSKHPHTHQKNLLWRFYYIGIID